MLDKNRSKEVDVSSRGFQYALRRLVNDKAFADAVAQDADVLTDTFVLSEDEKKVLGSIFQTANPGAGAGITIACYVACKEV